MKRNDFIIMHIQLKLYFLRSKRYKNIFQDRKEKYNKLFLQNSYFKQNKMRGEINKSIQFEVKFCWKIISDIFNNHDSLRSSWFTAPGESEIGHACIASRHARRKGRLRLYFTLPSPVHGNFDVGSLIYCASLTHNRYIIFIIRTRDTRSRAGSYDAPVSVNRI